MRLLTKTLLAAAVIAATPMMASAESNFQTGAGLLTASAHVDFQINIPNILYVRVGTGTDFTTVGTVDLVVFSPAAATLGVAGNPTTGVGGDIGSGVVTAHVKGNNGNNITFGVTTIGALNNGNVAQTITYSQISTAQTSGTLPPPALADGVTTNETLTANGAGIVDQAGTWTYTYLNTVFPAAGTYGGVNIDNSRVTYTATQL